MFQTYQEAEINFPHNLFPEGERTWRWIEISLHIPYFYLNVKVDAGKGTTCHRHFLFSHLKAMLDMMENSREEFIYSEIGLMSPGHMNGGDFYQLGKVKEIWESKAGRKQMFVMSDGTKLFNSVDEGDFKMDKDMELIYNDI